MPKPSTDRKLAVALERVLEAMRESEGTARRGDGRHGDGVAIEVGAHRYVLVRAETSSMLGGSPEQRAEGCTPGDGAEPEEGRLLSQGRALGLADAHALLDQSRHVDAAEAVAAGLAHLMRMGWAAPRVWHERALEGGDDLCVVLDLHDGFEADRWLGDGRRSDRPVCRLSAGYVAGWCEGALGVPVAATEISCRARGDERCRLVVASPQRIRDHVAQWARSASSTAKRAPGAVAPSAPHDAPLGVPHASVADGTPNSGPAPVEGLPRSRTVPPAGALRSGGPADAARGRSAEAALRDRLEIERLVANLSKAFIGVGPDTFDGEVDAMLRQIGEFVGADRAYVFQLRESGELKDNTHEWCAPGVEPEMDRLQGLPVRDFPYWMDALRELEDVVISNVSQMPDVARDEREHLQQQRIQSMLLVPMAASAELIGFLGFDAVRRARDWRQEDVTLLRMVADVLANAVGRIASDRSLRAAEAQLRRAQTLEAVGRLAGGVAHDFNNLLAVVSGNASFLLDSIPEGDERRRDVEDILVASERGARLTEQLLAFSRQQPQRPTTLSLNGVVRHAETMLRRLLGGHIVLETCLDPALRPVVGDAHLFELVAVNLALNARDAMPAGGRLRIETRNVEPNAPSSPRTAGEPRRPAVMLLVSDEGVGMDAETMSHVFEPFFTTKEVGRGTGLGLATVHGIVTQAGGEVTVESQPGGGTTFRVLLPAAPAEMASQPASVPSDRPTSGGATILVVEDEEPVRRVACRFLRRRGHRALEAADGVAACAIARDHAGPIDVLLTDMVMPGMLGPAVARRVEQLRPEIRVVYMSGYPQGPPGTEGSIPADARVLSKPFSSDELARAVEEALAGR